MALTKVGLALALLIAAKPAAADPPAAPCTTVAPVAIAPPAAPAPTGVNPCTTPPPPKMTCTNYQCPSGYLPKGAVFCGNAGDPDCGRDVCCTIVTTVTTTPGPTCDGFTCPKGWSKNANADNIPCAAGKCNMATCCNQNPCTTHVITTVTTTPGTTVTTTPAPTCGDFTCPKGWSKNAKSDTITCATGRSRC